MGRLRSVGSNPIPPSVHAEPVEAHVRGLDWVGPNLGVARVLRQAQHERVLVWWPRSRVIRYGLAIALFALPFPSLASVNALGFDGLAPVRIGMTVHRVEHVLHAKLALLFPSDDSPDGCAMASLAGREDALSYMFENGRVTRFDVGRENIKSAIRTVRGIGIGSSIVELRRAYGKRAKSSHNAYDNRWLDFEIKSPDAKAAIVFETEHGRVVRIRAGRLPAAEYIEDCL